MNGFAAVVRGVVFGAATAGLMLPGAALADEVPEAFIGTFMPHGLDGRQYVDDHIGLVQSAVQGCYESTLGSAPSLAGLMLMRVYVSSTGDVVEVDIVQNRTGSADLALCVETSVEAVAMRPSYRDNVSITVPVTFRMRDGARQVASTAGAHTSVSRR